MFQLIWVMDIASIPNQAGLLESYMNTTVTQQGLTRCDVILWLCDPLDHGAHSLIVMQQGHTTPSFFPGL